MHTLQMRMAITRADQIEKVCASYVSAGTSSEYAQVTKEMEEK